MRTFQPVFGLPIDRQSVSFVLECLEMPVCVGSSSTSNANNVFNRSVMCRCLLAIVEPRPCDAQVTCYKRIIVRVV